MGTDEQLDVVEVQLDGDQVALLQVYRLDDQDVWLGSGERDAARFTESSLDKIAAAIRQIAAKVGGAVQAARPDSATMELSFAFAAKAGTATAILVNADTSASVKVTLTWTKPQVSAAEVP